MPLETINLLYDANGTFVSAVRGQLGNVYYVPTREPVPYSAVEYRRREFVRVSALRDRAGNTVARIYQEQGADVDTVEGLDQWVPTTRQDFRGEFARVWGDELGRPTHPPGARPPDLRVFAHLAAAVRAGYAQAGARVLASVGVVMSEIFRDPVIMRGALLDYDDTPRAPVPDQSDTAERGALLEWE